MHMKWWILGANGMLGKQVQLLCRKRNIPFVASTKEEVDITQIETLRQLAAKIHPSHMINCAAYTHVDLAEEEQELAFLVNAYGAQNAARVAREMEARYILISTNYVFDGKEGPYFETSPCHPINVYGKSKLEGERLSLAEHPSTCIIRTSWLFGRGGKNLISSLIDLLQTQTTLRLVSDQLGKLTYVCDLAEWIEKLSDQTGIFHVANQGETSRYLVACALKALYHTPTKIEAATSAEFPTPAPRPHRATLDTSKVEKKFPLRPWQDAIEEFLSHA